MNRPPILLRRRPNSSSLYDFTLSYSTVRMSRCSYTHYYYYCSSCVPRSSCWHNKTSASLQSSLSSLGSQQHGRRKNYSSLTRIRCRNEILQPSLGNHSTIRSASIGSDRSAKTNFKVIEQTSSSKNDLKHVQSESEIDPRTIYNLLKLSTFTKSEMDWRFDNVIQAGDRLSENMNSSISINNSTASTLSAQTPVESSSIPVPASMSTSEKSTSLHQDDPPLDSSKPSEDQKLEKSLQLRQEHQCHVYQRTFMQIQDLEAYLFEHYKHMDDQWMEKKCTNLHPDDGVTNETHHGSMDINGEERQTRLDRIKKFAKLDAASIFRLLLINAPLDAKDDNLHEPSLGKSSSATANTANPTNNIAPSLIPSNSPNTNTTTINATNQTKPPPNTPTLTKHQFHQSLTTLATQIHYPTILPLAASMLLVGSSVGVISPVMPFVAEKLQLTSTQYGVVVSSFALSKMLGNVPSAILVERHGRKPYLVHSLWLVGMGVAGIGIAQDWIQLSLCRMTIGLGVAALTTASTLTVADVSTPLSRASTFSPVMSAFAAGTALGPALGGILCDEWGIQKTFMVVGGSYGALAIWNHLSLVETRREEEKLPWHADRLVSNDIDDGRMEKSLLAQNKSDDKLSTTISNAVRDTTEQWKSLMTNPRVRPIVIMNGFYLCAISGSQMTLLPLLLTGGGAASGAATGVALTATAVGQVYMWMSAVQVLGNPAAGRFADRAGKGAAIVAGGTLTSASMASVPLICAYGFLGDGSVGATGILDASNVNWSLLAASLGFWSLGGTLLATSHVAAISDAVSDSRRSQAIALLRTAGDVGFLCGAAGAGLAADMVGDVGMAMQVGSGVLLGATGWFALQTLALSQLDESRRRNDDKCDDQQQ